MARIANFIAFEIGWFACILGAAGGRDWVGPVLVGLLLAGHLSLTPMARPELWLIVTAGAMGFLIDTGHACLGVVRFLGQDSVWCPPWMVALWMNFATTLNWSLRWLRGRYAWAAALGALAGPASYYAGHRLGAIALHPVSAFAMAVLAVVWGAATPGLARLAEWLAPRPPDSSAI
jgi:hypothetical protein